MADMPSILPSLAKIDRANQNILNLDELFSKFLDTRPYTVVEEPDPNPQTRSFTVTRVEDVGLPLRVLVGEIAHHLRSAFDLLVYQLMRNANVTDDEILGRCAFPVIVDLDLSIPADLKKYEHTLRRKIDGVCPRARTLIDSLQPCRRDRHHSFLAQIDSLDNTDKHRLLLALIGSVNIRGFNFTDAVSGEVSTVPHHAYIPLQADAVIKAGPIHPEMNVNVNLPLQITFGEVGVFWCQPVIPKLQELSDIARLTIDSFGRYF